jgi:predicted dehydrogenase
MTAGTPTDGPSIVLVGTEFATKVHVPALTAAGWRVAAFVGRDPEKTRRVADAHRVPHASTSLEAVLDAVDAPAVAVTTPPAPHPGLVATAVAAGRHVLCEKPFAVDAKAAREMTDVAAAGGVAGLVVFQWRWSPVRSVMGLALAQGLIGVPKSFHLVDLVPVGPTRKEQRDWFYRADQGGGWTLTAGSHWLDQARLWFGEAESVTAQFTPIVGHDSDAEDTFSAQVQYAGGVRGVLHQTGAGHGRWHHLAAVNGTDGMVWSDGTQTWLADADGERVVEVPVELQLPGDPPTSGRDHVRPMTKLYTALADIVRGAPVDSGVPLPTFADGLAVLEVVDAIRASAAADGERTPVRAA